jgi:sulfur relay protein TusB/DsrH
MKLAVLMSDYRNGIDMIDRLSADSLGIIFVGNGVYHASTKEGGKASSLLDKKANFYALTEDFETRGITSAGLDSRVKAVNYGDLVDVIFNDYEKVIWL